MHIIYCFFFIIKNVFFLGNIYFLLLFVKSAVCYCHESFLKLDRYDDYSFSCLTEGLMMFKVRLFINK